MEEVGRQVKREKERGGGGRGGGDRRRNIKLSTQSISV